jgi:hypothetical protein
MEHPLSEPKKWTHSSPPGPKEIFNPPLSENDMIPLTKCSGSLVSGVLLILETNIKLKCFGQGDGMGGSREFIVFNWDMEVRGELILNCGHILPSAWSGGEFAIFA